MLLGLFLLLAAAVASSWSVLADLDRSLGHAIVGHPSWLVSPADTLGLATRDVGTGAVVAIAVALLWRPHRLWAPSWSESAFQPLTASFPSGHAMSGITMWVVLGVILLVAPVGGRLPRVIGALALAIGILMGPSRLVLGVHWPTDILGGWLLGAAVACAAAAGVLYRARCVS